MASRAGEGADMSTLRDRLIALADNHYESIVILGPSAARDIALAAARMALEDAETSVSNKPFAFYSDQQPHQVAGSVARQLTKHIRALRDSLADI